MDISVLINCLKIIRKPLKMTCHKNTMVSSLFVDEMTSFLYHVN